MKANDLGNLILSQIDFRVLQGEVLEVISLVLGKKEITAEDKNIVENSLGLWLACLLREPTLLDEFY